MKILYLDCSMGAAGDMLTAALIGLLPQPEKFVEEFNALGIPKVKMELEAAENHGISGLRVRVLAAGTEEGASFPRAGASPRHRVRPRLAGHGHMGLEAVERIIGSLPLPAPVRENALGVYKDIALAEAKVHGRPVGEVHFHEVGALDAIADVTAVCMLMDMLSPDKICASPVHVGSGTVRCAHGELPVPAPATAELLRGIPSYGGEISGELCTPTGAALLRRFATNFGPQPLMAVSALGRGLGMKEFSRPNCLRAFLGEAQANVRVETVSEISCNLDDMTGEAIGFALELLLENGALDAYTMPIGMKKSRPGVMLRCICLPEDEERLAQLMLRHTTSLGVRISSVRRITLPRECRQVETSLGTARVKTAPGRYKVEYEDAAAIARKNGLTLTEAVELVKKSDK